MATKEDINARSVQIRGVKQGQVTKLKGIINTFLRLEPPPEDLEQKLENYYIQLKTAFDDYSASHEFALANCKKEELEDLAHRGHTHSVDTNMVLNEIKKKLEEIRTTRHMQNLSLSGVSNIAPPPPPPPALKYPTLQLPTFSGRNTPSQHLDYQTWKRRFNTLIAKNPSLDDGIKLDYLHNSLSGPAFDLVKSYILPYQYRDAMRELDQRYGGEDKLLHEHLLALQNMPHVKHLSAQDIRKIISIIKNALSSLQASGWDRPREHIATIVLNVERVLPFQLCREWHLVKAKPTSQSQLDVLLEFLTTNAEAIEYSARFTQRDHKEHKKTHTVFTEKKEKEDQGKKEPRRDNPRDNRESNPRKVPYCHFCQSTTHNTRACRSPYPSEKIARIISAKDLCHNCLIKGHTSRTCRLDNQCSTEGCKRKGKHHPRLHRKPSNTSSAKDI